MGELVVVDFSFERGIREGTPLYQLLRSLNGSGAISDISFNGVIFSFSAANIRRFSGVSLLARLHAMGTAEIKSIEEMDEGVVVVTSVVLGVFIAMNRLDEKQKDALRNAHLFVLNLLLV